MNLRSLLTGLAAGISLGVLFAPKTGKDLRTEISSSDEKLKIFWSAIVEGAHDMSSETQTFLQSESVQKMLSDSKANLQSVVDQLDAEAKRIGGEVQKEVETRIKEAKKSLAKKPKTKKPATRKSSAKKTEKPSESPES